VLSKVAAYGFLRIVLPLFPYASVHYQTLMLRDRAGLDPVGHLDRVHDHRRPARGRLLLEWRPAGFITLGIFSLRPRAARARCCRCSTTASSPPLFFIVAALAARCGGRRTPRHGRGRVPRAGARDAVPDRRVRDLAMPGSSNFVGEFMILLGVFKAKLAIAVIAFLGVVGAAVYALRCSSGDAQPRRPRVQSREIGACARRLAIVPLVA
jgi:NADH-quinone oxidoreductase subunit M